MSQAGSTPLSSNASTTYREYIFPLTTITDPNIREVSHLAGQVINNKNDVEHATQHLLEQGPKCVLIKGGGLPDLAGQVNFALAIIFADGDQI